VWLGGDGETLTPEAVAARWRDILSLEGGREYADANAALMTMLAR